MDRLAIYDEVNQCETLQHLARIIRSLADDEGMIQGRTRKFSAEKMAQACEGYIDLPRNVLTREFGIRQQAMHIIYYTT